jgi:hypothetical protein
MTQAPTHSNDLSLVTLYDLYAGIQRNWRKALGHPDLMQSTNRTETHKHGPVTITKYRFERCGTRWKYENNKVNRHADWSVVGE